MTVESFCTDMNQNKCGADLWYSSDKTVANIVATLLTLKTQMENE